MSYVQALIQAGWASFLSLVRAALHSSSVIFFLHDIKDLVAGVVGLCVSGFQEARFPFVSEHF